MEWLNNEKQNIMKNKIISIFTILLIVPFLLIGQEEKEKKEKKENKNESLFGYFMAQDAKPVRNSYNSGYLIENQTSIIPASKTLELVIQHSLGSVENGISDIWGIMGSANTRLGLNYSITNWLQIGIGTTRNYKLQDLGLKINILQQSRKNEVPVTITCYHNFSINASKDSDFGVNYKFSHRYAFFNQLLITRKFCERFTLSVGGSFTHFNIADSLEYASLNYVGTTEHDKIALHFLARFKITEQSTFIINYDLPLKAEGIKEWSEIHNPPKSNFGIGWEITTATHAFQIFAGTATLIVPQYNVMLNQNDANLISMYHIGFNITRLWGF